MTLFNAQIGTEYRIRAVNTQDRGLENFLFSLGCYAGEPVTVISRKRSSCVISLKDSRYCIDRQLAGAIDLTEEVNA